MRRKMTKLKWESRWEMTVGRLACDSRMETGGFIQDLLDEGWELIGLMA